MIQVVPNLSNSVLDFFFSAGVLILSLIMSWRDIRTREVLDRELAWLAFMAIILRLNEGGSGFILTNGSFWIIQYLDLMKTASGAIFLAGLSFLTKWVAGRQLIGSGDIFFMLAAGFMLTPAESLATVSLAFLLAFPFSLLLFLTGKNSSLLPFIPFLSLAFVLIKWGPPSLRLWTYLLK